MSHYTVTLRDNATGETREVDAGTEWHDAAEFLWTEGNYGCDCNRHLFFWRHVGVEPDDNVPCGGDRYNAMYATLPDGTRVELDGEL